MYRIAVCDDEENTLKYICSCCEEILTEAHIKHKIEAFSAIKELAEALAADLRMKKRSERAVLKSGSKLVTLPIETFIYAESYDHNVLVHTEDGVKIFRTSLTDMERRTEGCHVCRCHNSYIVNMRFISEITKHSIILKTGVRLPVGRKYGSLLQASFTRYINGVK